MYQSILFFGYIALDWWWLVSTMYSSWFDSSLRMVYGCFFGWEYLVTNWVFWFGYKNLIDNCWQCHEYGYLWSISCQHTRITLQQYHFSQNTVCSLCTKSCSYPEYFGFWSINKKGSSVCKSYPLVSALFWRIKKSICDEGETISCTRSWCRNTLELYVSDAQQAIPNPGNDWYLGSLDARP